MQIKTYVNCNLPCIWLSLVSLGRRKGPYFTNLSKLSFKNTIMMKLRKLIGQHKKFTHEKYTHDSADVRIFWPNVRICSSRSVKFWKLSVLQ